MGRTAMESPSRENLLLSLKKASRELDDTRHALHESEDTLWEMAESMKWQTSQNADLKKTSSNQTVEIEEQKVIGSDLLQSLKREKLTKHIIQLMNRTFDVNIILEMVTSEVGTFLKADRCTIVHYEDHDINKPHLAAQYCLPEKIHPVLEESIPCELATIQRFPPRKPI